MNSEHNSEALSLDESRDLLTEVRCAADPQTNLHEFAGLLCQLIDLYDRADDDQIAQFVGSGLDEVRQVMDADGSTSQKMESLGDEAINRWGEQLSSLDDGDEDSIDAWEMSGGGDADTDSDAADDDLIAPSADEIGSLLAQLGGGAAPAPEAAPAAQPTAQAAPQPTAQAARPTPVIVEEEDEGPEMTVDKLDPELREAFMDDASGCLASMEDASLRLEANPSDGDSLNQMCRELHTLKGASASVGLTSLADQMHKLEDQLRDDQQSGRAPDINELLKCVDSVRAQVLGEEAETAGDAPAPAPSAAPSPAPTQTTAPAPAAAKPAAPATPAPTKLTGFSGEAASDDESVRVKASQLNRLMDMLAELVMLRNRRETELADLQEIYHELIGSVSKMRLLSNEGHIESTATKSVQLSEVANDVLEAAQHLRNCARPVAEANTAVSGFIRQFRQELVELRRTPVSGLFRRLQRVVRDAAQAEAKQVRLELVGEDAGIERSLQQRLYEPLLHIVRNCVCHGIEDAEGRARSGKDPVGTITLEANSGPELFTIEIRDDGKGLDYDAIRRRGIESGLISANQVPTREELSQLIFQPGFSTRQTANQVAGRGVGMDVVASTLQRMRGWLEVDSEPNKGTRIRLSFPLPSVIQHAMVFRSAGQLFALPMQSVQTAGDTSEKTLCLALSNLLGSDAVIEPENCQRITLADDNAKSVTLLVDEIVGPEELVVRPLPTLLKQHPFCGGATLSGMGETVLLLDAHRVVESQSRRMRSLDLSAAAAGPAPQRPRVLVVDDSLSARKRVVRSLRRYAVDIVEASDGKEALEILKRDAFVAIFSDMEMPHVTGMELLAEVNAESAIDPPPVVIISSRNEDEFTGRARELGATDYLIKPLADEALDGALASIPALSHLLTDSASTLQTSGEIQ